MAAAKDLLKRSYGVQVERIDRWPVDRNKKCLVDGRCGDDHLLLSSQGSDRKLASNVIAARDIAAIGDLLISRE